MFNEKPLIIFELANNHMGDVEHGLKTVDAFAKFVTYYPFRFAFKFQFRDLDSFIHPSFRSRMDLKYVKRFSQTTLSREQFYMLLAQVKEAGMLTIVTPFDETSVDLAVDLGVEVVKIASCSLTDWPLLEKIALTDKPLLASSAGSSFADIDRVVSFFQHRGKHFALMHCVGEYPTKAHNLQINQIGLLQKRYPGVQIGFSTHEEPDNYDSVMVAIGKGARIFEKHVAVETAEYARNAYSVTPADMERWLDNAAKAFAMLGTDGERHSMTSKELADLRQFKRGVYARRDLPAGRKLSADDVFFAFPNVDGQLVANDMSKYISYRLKNDIKVKAPICFKDVESHDCQAAVYGIVQRVKSLIGKAGVTYPGGADLEISHHYGIDRFNEVGATMITVVNRDYCKKLIVMLAGQTHPEQFHKKKEETFHLLYGDVAICLDGVTREIKPGETVIVEPGTKHGIHTRHGCVLEEISSTHHLDDSYYGDPEIAGNRERKTIIKYWFD